MADSGRKLGKGDLMRIEAEDITKSRVSEGDDGVDGIDAAAASDNGAASGTGGSQQE